MLLLNLDIDWLKVSFIGNYDNKDLLFIVRLN